MFYTFFWISLCSLDQIILFYEFHISSISLGIQPEIIKIDSFGKTQSTKIKSLHNAINFKYQRRHKWETQCVESCKHDSSAEKKKLTLHILLAI